VKSENKEENEEDDEENKEDREGEPGKRKYVRQSTKAKQQNIQKEFTIQELTPEEKFQLALESAARFNDRLFINKIKLKQEIKRIERNAVVERSSLENAGGAFPGTFVPIYLYDKYGSEYFCTNQTTDIEKTTVGKFRKMNLDNEHTFLVPEQYNKIGMHPARRFQRRRKRRTMRLDEDE